MSLRGSFYDQPVANPEETVTLPAGERLLIRKPFYGYRQATA